MGFALIPVMPVGWHTFQRPAFVIEQILSVMDDIPCRSTNQSFVGFVDATNNQQVADPPEENM